MLEWNAIILAGGRASRLGGIDKSALVFEGSTLLDRAVASVAAASSVMVLDGRTESPRYAGPAAATIAGLNAFARPRARWTAVIAADLPFVGSAMPLLLAALETAPYTGGVIAVDDDGRRQPLLAIYSTASLALAGAEARGTLENLGMMRLISPIHLLEVPVPSGLCADVDTPAAARGLGISVEEALIGV